MSSEKPVIIFWFRRDLRLHDNRGLSKAIKAAQQRGFNVLPLFIFDEEILNPLPESDARVTFIYQQLSEIHERLQQHQSSLLIQHGSAISIYQMLAQQYDIRAVFCNHDYEPQAISRDKSVKAWLNEQGIAWRSFKDQVIFERNDVLKNDGKPYTVFTPYKNRWLATLNPSTDLLEYPCNLSVCLKHQALLPSLADIGFQTSSITVQPYDLNALRQYAKQRDYPAVEDGTSKLSPHLRFGTVSIREMVGIAMAENEVFLSELIWREFFMQILWHFPRVVNESFRVEYDQILWRNHPEEFQAWCEGKTGYPLVDAGMRELNQTGYMHNRVRMVTASFLCKHLLIDWRWGERYFAEKLLDYELSANNGNWQWAAGTGCDAAPYFRIFNPETQFKKFDQSAEYVRQFVPEFDQLSYPQPIVEHRYARERCLVAYRAAKSHIA